MYVSPCCAVNRSLSSLPLLACRYTQQLAPTLFVLSSVLRLPDFRDHYARDMPHLVSLPITIPSLLPPPSPSPSPSPAPLLFPPPPPHSHTLRVPAIMPWLACAARHGAAAAHKRHPLTAILPQPPLLSVPAPAPAPAAATVKPGDTIALSQGGDEGERDRTCEDEVRPLSTPPSTRPLHRLPLLVSLFDLLFGGHGEGQAASAGAAAAAAAAVGVPVQWQQQGKKLHLPSGVGAGSRGGSGSGSMGLGAISRAKAEACVELLVSAGYGWQEVQRLPFGVLLPVLQASEHERR